MADEESDDGLITAWRVVCSCGLREAGLSTANAYRLAREHRSPGHVPGIEADLGTYSSPRPEERPEGPVDA